MMIQAKNKTVSEPHKDKMSIEEAFADVYGQLEFFEDPDTPTIEEWSLEHEDLGALELEVYVDIEIS